MDSAVRLAQQTATDRLSVGAGQFTYGMLEEPINRFIRAWDEGVEPPALREFLPETSDLRWLTLVELIKIDLEYRWHVRGAPRHVEDYLAEFPELAVDGVPCDLICEEYYWRHRVGLQVRVEDYLERFPQRAEELGRLLKLPATTASVSAIRSGKGEPWWDLRPGDRVDDFDLLTLLGKGTFAAVFLARQNSMQRLVALKVSADRSVEPQTLARFDHENIVRIYDQRPLPDMGVRLLYMQYVPGGTLEEVIRGLGQRHTPPEDGRALLNEIRRTLERRGECSEVPAATWAQFAKWTWPQVVCWLGSRLAFALDYAHHQGVLHRDVKPANVLLTVDGVPKLADFNVSCCSKLEGVTPAAYFGGSLAYMSPEQLEACDPAHDRCPSSLDGRSDLYSLGILLWELMTGHRPFADQPIARCWSRTLQQLVESRRHGPDWRELDARGACPSGMRGVLERCLAAELTARCRSGAELARQLELCTDPEIQEYLFPPIGSWRQRIRRHLLLAVLLATLAPSCISAAFNFFYNRAEIIAHLDPSAESHFLTVQAIINLTAFPFGLCLMAYLAWNAVRIAVGSAVPHPSSLGQAQQRALCLGDCAAVICVVLWTLAAIAYPVTMRWGQFSVPLSAAAHFFFSLILCGLFAVALNFFGVTSLSIRAILPPLLERPDLAPLFRVRLESLMQRCWGYLAMSASVPMLATMALVATPSQDVRGYLAAVSITGLAACGVVVWLFRSMLRDLAIVSRIVGQHTQPTQPSHPADGPGK